MCNYQTLFHEDKTGYVVRCNKCERLQIGYSNIMLTFSIDEFESFRHWLKKKKEEQYPATDKTLRCIIIPTSCKETKLLLSMIELTEFSDMLESADSELRSLAMIKLFE